jgi:hypothetical protein
MRRSPSIVPDADDRDVYLVLDDFDRLGRAWREADEAATSRADVVRALLEGQYAAPVRVIAFNTAECWARDVSEDIADALAQICTKEDEDIPGGLEDFVERHGSGRPVQLPLPLRRIA